MTRRIRERSTFARFRSEGRRFRHGPLWCSWIPDPTADPPHVAYAIGRTIGGAVTRNRLRRRLRALVRDEARRGLPAGWYLVGAAPEAAAVSWDSLRATWSVLASRVREAASA